MSAPSSPSSVASADRRKTPSSWDPHDDVVLRHLKEQLKLGWKEIAAHFPNRTTNACQFRWRRLMSGTLRSNGPSNAPSPQMSPAPSISSPATLSPAVSASPDYALNAFKPRPPLSSGLSGSPGTPLRSYHQSSSTSSLSALTNKPWAKEEDDLILSRADLRLEELSLLLPHRSEYELQSRLALLSSDSQPAGGPPPLQLPQTLLGKRRSDSTSTISSANSTGSMYSPSTPVTIPKLGPLGSAAGSTAAGSVGSTGSSGTPGSANYTLNGRAPPRLSPKTSYFDGRLLPVPVTQRRSINSAGDRPYSGLV